MGTNKLNENTKHQQTEKNSIGRGLLDLEKEKLKLIDSKYSKESDQDISFFNSLLPHTR